MSYSFFVNSSTIRVKSKREKDALTAFGAEKV